MIPNQAPDRLCQYRVCLRPIGGAAVAGMTVNEVEVEEGEEEDPEGLWLESRDRESH